MVNFDDAAAAQDQDVLVSDEHLATLGFDTNSPALEVVTDAPTRRRILVIFHDEHRESSARIRDSVLNGDRREARDLLHKLMGTTATVGLDDLRAKVIELQDLIHSNPPTIGPAEVEPLTTELDRVIGALSPLAGGDA